MATTASGSVSINNESSASLNLDDSMHLSQRIRSGSLNDNESSMTVFVVDKEAHILFGVGNADTVGSLKSKIAERRGIPLDQQRLVFGGKQLEDDCKLSDYKIRAQSCIQLGV